MSCRVATFARDPGPFTSCHVVTNAWDLELKDKDKCQKSRTNLAHPNVPLGTVIVYGRCAHFNEVRTVAHTSTKSFFVHHTQRIAFAAQLYDAMAIRKEIGSRKQRLLAASRYADGAP